MDASVSPTPHIFDAEGLALCLWQHQRQMSGSEKPSINVLFLHGYYDTGRSFDDLVEALSPGVNVYCLDFRGHGDSAQVGAGGSYHLLDYAKDTFCALQHLSQSGTAIDVLVGHSMGANIALMVAGALPGITRGLLLLDGIGAPSEDDTDAPERLGATLKAMLAKHSLHRCSGLADAAKKIQANNSNLTSEGAERMARHAIEPDPENPASWIFKFDPRMRGPTPFRFSEATWRAYCERVKVPTWILKAEHGYLPSDGEYAERVGAFQDARLVLMPEVGHHLHVDAPARVANQINAFCLEHFGDHNL